MIGLNRESPAQSEAGPIGTGFLDEQISWRYINVGYSLSGIELIPRMNRVKYHYINKLGFEI